jgi:hypothetical protein
MAEDGSWFPNHYTVTPIDRIASATFALRGQHFNLPQPRDKLARCANLAVWPKL